MTEQVPRRNEICEFTDGCGRDVDDRHLVDEMLGDFLPLIDESDHDDVIDLFSDEGVLGNRNYQKIAALATFKFERMEYERNGGDFCTSKSAGVVSFTASGKTRIMLLTAVLHCLFKRDARVIVVVPQLQVKMDVQKKFDSLFEKEPFLEEIFLGKCINFGAGDAKKLWGPANRRPFVEKVMGTKLIVVNVGSVGSLLEALPNIGWVVSLVLGAELLTMSNSMTNSISKFCIPKPFSCLFSGMSHRVLNCCSVVFERTLAWGVANEFAKNVVFRSVVTDADNVECIVKSYIQKRALSRKQHAAKIGDQSVNFSGKARVNGKWYCMDGLKQICIIQTTNITEAKKVRWALKKFQVPFYHAATQSMKMEKVEAEFIASNRREELYNDANDADENRRIMEMADKAEIHFLVHVKMAGDGVDIVRCNMYAFLCPVSSETQMVQGIGRSLRRICPRSTRHLSPCPSDNEALIIAPTVFKRFVEYFKNPNYRFATVEVEDVLQDVELIRTKTTREVMQEIVQRSKSERRSDRRPLVNHPTTQTTTTVVILTDSDEEEERYKKKKRIIRNLTSFF